MILTREENKTMRTEQEIQKEYRDLCTQAGEFQYKIQEHKMALDSINQHLFDLTKEFVALKDSAPLKEVAPEVEDIKTP